jgi:hypothetical protein
MRKLVIVMAVAAMGSTLAQADDTVKCAARPDLPAPCYKVRGRLNAWNGGPATEKIWVVGTKRLLAVYEPPDGKMIAPKAIVDHLHDFFTQIYANYEVCPLVKESPGDMSSVCIESAKNIRVESHEEVDGKDHVTKVERIPDTLPGTLIEL